MAATPHAKNPKKVTTLATEPSNRWPTLLGCDAEDLSATVHLGQLREIWGWGVQHGRPNRLESLGQIFFSTMDHYDFIPAPEAMDNPKQDLPSAGSRIKLAATDRVFILLTVVACALVAYGLWVAAGDPRGEHSWSMALVLLAPSLPVAWSVAQLIWNGTRPELLLRDVFLRIIAVPAFSVLPTLVVAVVTVLLPVVSQTIEDARYGEYGTHHFFSLRDGSPLTIVLTGSGSLGYAGAILVGLLVFVYVVLPVMAFGNPKKFAAVNEMDPSEEHAQRNTWASQGLSVFLMLTFLIPTLIVFGKEYARGYTLGEAVKYSVTVFQNPYPSEVIGDIAWTFGAILVPIAGVAFFIAKIYKKD